MAKILVTGGAGYIGSFTMKAEAESKTKYMKEGVNI